MGGFLRLKLYNRKRTLKDEPNEQRGGSKIMRENDRLRFLAAVAVSFLAHVTAVFLLFPLYGVVRAVKVLFAKENGRLRVALILAILLHIAVLMSLVPWMMSAQDLESEQVVDVDLWGADERDRSRVGVSNGSKA